MIYRFFYNGKIKDCSSRVAPKIAKNMPEDAFVIAFEDGKILDFGLVDDFWDNPDSGPSFQEMLQKKITKKIQKQFEKKVKK